MVGIMNFLKYGLEVSTCNKIWTASGKNPAKSPKMFCFSGTNHAFPLFCYQYNILNVFIKSFATFLFSFLGLFSAVLERFLLKKWERVNWSKIWVKQIILCDQHQKLMTSSDSCSSRNCLVDLTLVMQQTSQWYHCVCSLEKTFILCHGRRYEPYKLKLNLWFAWCKHRQEIKAFHWVI